jgi:hypothetical protein
VNADSVRWHADEVINKLLVGGVIVRAIIDKEETCSGFVLKMPDGRTINVWVQSDEEGNDAGFLMVEDR